METGAVLGRDGTACRRGDRAFVVAHIPESDGPAADTVTPCACLFQQVLTMRQEERLRC